MCPKEQQEYLMSLDSRAIESGQLEMDKLLYNSLYYPASGTDGSVIEDCSKKRRYLDIVSFVYADYAMDKMQWDSDRRIGGYHIVGTREFDPDDVILPVNKLRLPYAMKKFHQHEKFADVFENYAFWSVYERDDDRSEEYGPKRISLLFFSRDGVQCYSSLYLTSNITPKAMAIIQPGTGTGLNWTDFRNTGQALEWTVRQGGNYPEYFYYGGNGSDGTNFSWPGYVYSGQMSKGGFYTLSADARI